MKILILGAAGQISRMLTDELLTQTSNNLVLYARNASTRLNGRKSERVKIVDGDFKDVNALAKAMEGIDVVYLNDMGDDEATKTIIGAMNKAGVSHLIGASVLGIYDEVPGAFGQWNKRMMVGLEDRVRGQIVSAKAVETSSLNYTLLRLTWLYNQKENKNYMLTQKGEPFIGAQVTREAVTQLIVDIITAKDDRYNKKSIGVSEPGTDWDKPSFY